MVGVCYIIQIEIMVGVCYIIQVKKCRCLLYRKVKIMEDVCLYNTD